MSSEGAPQGSIPLVEGDGYSKVVKRTVVRSEGDDTEVHLLHTCAGHTKQILFLLSDHTLQHLHLRLCRKFLKSLFMLPKVTFVEGFPASTQETADACKVSHTEKTTVLEAERTMTSHGDPSLACDLPSAHDDFKQVR